MLQVTRERSLPIEERILAAEGQLIARRQSARVHLATAEERLRRRLTAPATLLVAAGVGIALGRVTSWHGPRTLLATARVGRDAPPGEGLLSMLLEALSIAAPMAAMFAALDRSSTERAAGASDSDDAPS